MSTNIPTIETKAQNIPEVIPSINASEISPTLMSEVIEFVAKNQGNLDKAKSSIENMFLRHTIMSFLISKGLSTEEALKYLSQVDLSIDSYKRAIDTVAGEA